MESLLTQLADELLVRMDAALGFIAIADCQNVPSIGRQARLPCVLLHLYQSMMVRRRKGCYFALHDDR